MLPSNIRNQIPEILTDSLLSKPNYKPGDLAASDSSRIREPIASYLLPCSWVCEIFGYGHGNHQINRTSGLEILAVGLVKLQDGLFGYPAS
jgi:hypothetical protein